MQDYLPGSYTFKVTGTDGTSSAYTTFTLTLENPCPSSTLSFASQTPFDDQSVYRYSDTSIAWSIPEVISSST